MSTCQRGDTRKWGSLGDAELQLDEVDAEHLLAHRMLDLDAAVQLEQVELAAVEDELRRAGVDVADRACEAHGSVAHLRAEFGVERHRRGLLEQLLVAALHGALALAETDDRVVRVGKQLDLHVAGTLEVALEEEPAVAERRLRLARGRLDGAVELGGVAHHAHAAAAAPAGRLDEEWEPELVRLPAGHDGDARFARDPLRLELVAARAQGRGGRSDPDESGV